MTANPRAARAHGLDRLLRSPSMPVLLTLALAAIGIAALLPLLQSSWATTTNGHIQELEREKVDWQARVQELEASTAALSSLDRIEKEAIERLKMGYPAKTIYITVPGQAPAEASLPPRLLGPGQETSATHEPWWERALGWLP